MIELPLFPLGIVVFPRQPLNLHIFEERYKQLIHDCHNEDITFGVCTYINDKIQYGTEVALLEIANTDASGNMDIKTKGLRPFQVDTFKLRTENKLYPSGTVSFLDGYKYEYEVDFAQEVYDQVRYLYKLLNVNYPYKQQEIPYTVYQISHIIGLSIAEELELLLIKDEMSRLQYVHKHVDKMLLSVNKTEQIKNRVKLNGHFKNLKPPTINL